MQLPVIHGDGALVWDITRNLALNGLGAYLVTRLRSVRRAITESHYHGADKLVLALVFGGFSAAGNFIGIPVLGALANTRIVGPIAGGLIGGPLVGIGAGFLGGVVRYSLGGYTAMASMLANVCAGLIGGLVYGRLGARRITVPVALATAVLAELNLKLWILTCSKPFPLAWQLEKTIALPTIAANAAAVGIFILVVRDVYREQEKVQAYATQQALLAHAELRALKAQVNPHFLFNTLSTVGALTRSDPDAARGMIKDLSVFLRRSLDRGEEMSTLGDELETVALYLRLEQTRFGGRVRQDIQVPEDLLGQPLPVFTLQPLVENAIKHGIGPRREGGTVTVRAGRGQEGTWIEVRDDGLGIPAEDLARLNADGGAPSGSGMGIGLQNIHRRLQIIFGPGSGLRLSSEGGTTARLTLPAQP
ncbi:MAG: LytS/YhcK type 5TM receptor domain-containing protein [Holophaga sp.]|nr:LytS/YhcK type 5TM receptor domain-containing protein [Holophaga sp.]